MRAGDLVGEHFEIQHLAGAGGMGAVYRAIDRRTNAAVAVKVMHGRGASDPVRFLREAQVLAALHHPRIVRYLAHGVGPEGDPFMAMEWLEGEDLAHRLERAGLTIDESLALTRYVAEALAFAHERGVVHRDLKPANVFLPDGDLARAMVLDFGLARIADGRGATVTGTALGTPGYMAPEQVRGEKSVDARADVFSLGCVLFECLTRRAVFVGSHPIAVMVKVLLEEPPRVRDLLLDVPAEVDLLVARMLSQDPGGRPADGAEVATELVACRTRTGPVTPSEAPTRVALTTGEQRLLCVILVSPVVATTGGEALASTLASAGVGEVVAGWSEVASRYGASLDVLLDGSLVVVLRGAGAATDQAMRAARCALALRDANPGAAIALATGRGALSSRWPVGDVADRGASLLQVARTAHAALGISVDEVTAGLLDVSFDLGGDEHGLVLRGERETIEVPRTLLGKPSPCVGRERELTTLLGTLAECVADSVACAVLVSAPAGVGKSRLRYEFMGAVQARHPEVQFWLGRGDPVAAGATFAMIAPSIRRAAGVLEGEALVVRQQKLRARVARRFEDAAKAARVTEFLGELTGTPFPDEHSVQLRAARSDPTLMGDQMRQAWEDFLAAECDAHPVVLILEDLHWSDEPSIRFIDRALRNLRDKSWMVLALSRPEVQGRFPHLWAGRGLTRIELGALSQRASERLVRRVLGEEIDAALVARVVNHADGNAFYLEELVRAVAEGKGATFPATVLAMVQARLEALDSQTRRVLRAASVLGDVFWRGGVAALIGDAREADELRDPLKELLDLEFVEERQSARFAGEDEYAFRHGLVREAAYGMLTDDDRVLGHRLAGGWLERVGESDPAVVAGHFDRGGESARAVTWYQRAAEQALKANDFDVAIARVERAVACGAAGRELGELRLVHAMAEAWRRDVRVAVLHAREAFSVLPRGSVSWYRAAGLLATQSQALGEGAAIVEIAAAMPLEPEGSESVDAWLTATVLITMSLTIEGHTRREVAHVVERLDRFVKRGHVLAPDTRARLLMLRGVRASIAGDAGEYLQCMRAAVACFEESGDRRMICTQNLNVASGCYLLGQLAEAERILRENLAVAERLSLRGLVAAALETLSGVLADRGQVREAIALGLRAVEEYSAQGNRRWEGGARRALATVYLRGNDLPNAELEASAALDLSAPESSGRAGALAALARVRLAQGRAEEAVALAREATRVVEAIGGMEGGDADVRLVLAESLRAVDPAAARIVIAAARDRLLERATMITDPALRDGFLAGAPDNARTLTLANAWCGGENG